MGKPRLVLGVIGQAGHGKTTLTAAIVKAVGHSSPRFRPVVPDGRVPVCIARGFAINVAYADYETAARQCAIFDTPGDADPVKNLKMDCAILAVSAESGVMPTTLAQVALAQRLGVPHLVAVLTKADLVAEPGLLELAELEVRALLGRHGFAGAPVVRVSGLRALAGDPQWTRSVLELLTTIEESVPLPERALDRPFLMPVEHAWPDHRGLMVTGTVEGGTITVGDQVEVVGIRPSRSGICAGLEVRGRSLARAVAGDRASMVLPRLKRDQIRVGQVLCLPGSLRAYHRFHASVHVLSTIERAQRFSFATGEAQGTIRLDRAAYPGETAGATVELRERIALRDGLGFAIREGRRTVGAGTVIIERSRPA